MNARQKCKKLKKQLKEYQQQAQVNIYPIALHYCPPPQMYSARCVVEKDGREGEWWHDENEIKNTLTKKLAQNLDNLPLEKAEETEGYIKYEMRMLFGKVDFN